MDQTMELPTLDNEVQPPVEKSSDTLDAIFAAAVQTGYGDTSGVSPLDLLRQAKNKTVPQRDEESGATLRNALLPEAVAGENPSEVASAIIEDSVTPGITERAGAELVGDPDTLAMKKAVMRVTEEHDDLTNGFWENAYEMVKSAIPWRANFASKALIGTGWQGNVTNFVDYFRAAEPEDQLKLFQGVLNNISKFEEKDDYWSETSSFLNHLTSNSANEDLLFGEIFQTADILLAAGELKAAKGLRGLVAGKTDIAKAVEAAGNPDLAGEMQAAAISDPSIGRTIGVEPNRALTNTIMGTGPATETITNMDGAVMIEPKVAAFRKTIDAQFEEAKNALLPEVFDEPTRTKALDKLVDQALEEIKASNVPNAQIQPKVTSSVDSDGNVAIDIEYNVKDKFKKDGKTIDKRFKGHDKTKKVRTHLTKDAWQGLDDYDTDHVGPIASMVASPKHNLAGKVKGTTAGRTVENAGLVVNAQQVFAKALSEASIEAQQHAGRGLNPLAARKARQNVDNLLSEQDKVKRVFTVEEAKRFNPDLTSNELTSYYMQNELTDLARIAKDDETYKAARLMGAEEYNLGDNVLGFGRSFNSTGSKGFKEAVDSSYLKSTDLPSEIYDASARAVVRIDDVDAYLQNNNAKLVVLDKDEVLDDGNTHRIVISHTTDINPLRRESLERHRVQGYTPHIRQDAKYFIKDTYEEVVNGKTVQKERTYGGWASKDERDAELANRQRNLADPSYDSKGVISTKGEYDREGFGAFSSDDNPKPNDKRGLFLGHRAKHDIEWGTHAEDIDSPSQAIAKNMAHLARTIPLNTWRMEATNNWAKEVRNIDPNLTPNIHTRLPDGDSKLEALEHHRQYLASVVGIPDKESIYWERMTRNLSEWIEFGKSNAVSRAVRRAGTIDPVNYVKTMTFHSLLGWFNPSQLIVQSFNMATAMSIHPLTTAKTLNKAMALRAALYTDDKSAINLIAKKISLDGDELADTIKQFKRAGVDQINTNADFDAAIAGHGVTRAAVSKAANSGLLFYRQGELAGRTVSYTIARHAYMDEKDIKSWKDLTDQDHREIKEKFDNLSLNLGKENKTRFQQGITSLPTQFWHVQTKFIEAFMGKKFTPAERFRLVLGQSVLFGVAGIPFGTMLAEQWHKMFREEDGTSGSPVDEEVIRQGLISFIAGDVNVASRGGIGNSLTDSLMGLFEEQTGDKITELFGASGTMFKRGSYAAKILSAHAGAHWEDIPEADFVNVLSAFAQITSTGNNLEQAYTMHKLNRFQSKTNAKINWEDPKLSEIVGKAVGFQAVRESQLYELVKDSKRREKFLDNQASTFFQIMRSMDLDPRSAEFPEEYYKNLTAWTASVTDNELDAADLSDKIWRKMNNNDDAWSKAVKSLLNKDMSTQLNPANISLAKGE